MLGLGEGCAIGEFGLEVAEFRCGAVEGAFVGRVEFRESLHVFVEGSGGEKGLGLVFAGNAHVPKRVEDLAEQEALSFPIGAHVGVEAFEELVEFEDFFGVDGKLRGVDSVLAGVE